MRTHGVPLQATAPLERMVAGHGAMLWQSGATLWQSVMTFIAAAMTECHAVGVCGARTCGDKTLKMNSIQ